MSLALYAQIAIRIDARAGEWVPVEELARFLGLASSQVCTACEAMLSHRLLLANRGQGGAIVAVCAPHSVLEA